MGGEARLGLRKAYLRAGDLVRPRLRRVLVALSFPSTRMCLFVGGQQSSRAYVRVYLRGDEALVA